MRSALLVLGLLAAFPAPARILDFHTDIRVAKSGELSVTERITVEVEPGQAFSGLVRELNGPVSPIDVIRNGHPEPHTLEETRLRVGAAPLTPGRHLYQISYRTTRHIRFQDGYDELRWKLAPAERITAEVILPATVPARDIRTGALGGEHESFVRDGRAAFRARQPVTLVMRFPNDVVASPGIGQRVRWFLSDYGGILLVVLGLGLTAWVLYRFKSLSART